MLADTFSQTWKCSGCASVSGDEGCVISITHGERFGPHHKCIGGRRVGPQKWTLIDSVKKAEFGRIDIVLDFIGD